MRGKKKKKEPATNGDAKGDEAKKALKIKAYDYRSWDKFDVVKIALFYISVTFWTS